MIRHNDIFASANEVVGEAFSAFVVIDDDFIDVLNGVDFLLGFLIESVAAIGDGMLVNNRDSKVDIVPEAVGVISERINMLGAVVIKLR